jgi:hypothetical protein
VFIDLKVDRVEQLCEKLQSAIYNYRLYTDVQLTALFEQAEAQNPHIDKQSIQGACEDVRYEFDQS